MRLARPVAEVISPDDLEHVPPPSSASGSSTDCIASRSSCAVAVGRSFCVGAGVLAARRGASGCWGTDVIETPSPTFRPGVGLGVGTAVGVRVGRGRTVAVLSAFGVIVVSGPAVGDPPWNGWATVELSPKTRSKPSYWRPPLKTWVVSDLTPFRKNSIGSPTSLWSSGPTMRLT